MFNLKLVLYLRQKVETTRVNPMFSLTSNSDYTYRTKWKIDAELEPRHILLKAYEILAQRYYFKFSV